MAPFASMSSMTLAFLASVFRASSSQGVSPLLIQKTRSAASSDAALDGRSEYSCGDAPRSTIRSGIPIPAITRVTSEWVIGMSVTTFGIFADAVPDSNSPKIAEKRVPLTVRCMTMLIRSQVNVMI